MQSKMGIKVWFGERKESNVSERKFKNYFDEHFKFSFLKILYHTFPLSGHVLD